MMSSGSLKDISSSELRVYLTSWESIIESLRIREADLRNQREKVPDMFRSKECSIQTIFDQSKVAQDVMGIPPKQHTYSNIDNEITGIRE
jgi:hypothetical protein